MPVHGQLGGGGGRRRGGWVENGAKILVLVDSNTYCMSTAQAVRLPQLYMAWSVDTQYVSHVGASLLCRGYSLQGNLDVSGKICAPGKVLAKWGVITYHPAYHLCKYTAAVYTGISLVRSTL